MTWSEGGREGEREGGRGRGREGGGEGGREGGGEGGRGRGRVSEAISHHTAEYRSLLPPSHLPSTQ